MKDLTSSGSRGVAAMAAAIGAVAVGAFAIGALALGRLMIRRLSFQKALNSGRRKVRDSTRDPAPRRRDHCSRFAQAARRPQDFILRVTLS